MPTRKRKRIALKTLSQERQELLRLMHRFQFGSIRNMPVVGGEPRVEQADVFRKARFDRTNATRPESRNYILKAEQLSLLEQLDEIGDGVIDHIKFQFGLPVNYYQRTDASRIRPA